MSKSGTTRKTTTNAKGTGGTKRQTRSSVTGQFVLADPKSGGKGVRVAKTVGHDPLPPKGRAEDRWADFDELTDKDIARAIADDPDAAPILGEEFWRNAKVTLPVPKQAISIRLDEDVLTYFKAQGPGYQSRINAVLRSYVDTKKD